MEKLIEQKRALNPSPKKDPTQFASVDRVMNMTDEELEAYRNRPLPNKENWKREILERAITPQEYAIHKGIQRSEKNMIGQIEIHELPAEKKEAAVQAFMHEGPAKVTETQIRNSLKYGFYDLDPYQTSGPQTEWVILPWYKALYYWFKGMKVESTSTEGPKDWRDFMNQKNFEK